jgi:hypothetical protein
MSKFLTILEEHDPSNQSKMDAAFQAKFFLYEQEVPFSSEGSKIILHTEKGDIVMEVIGIKHRQQEVEADAEEDALEINPSDMAADITDRYKQKPMWKRALKSVANTGEKQVAAATERQAKELYIPLAQFVGKQTDAAKAALQKAKAKVKINQ